MTQLIPATSSVPGAPGPGEEAFILRASNVTGTQEIPVELDRATTVGAITESIAHRMALPDDVVWGLRDDDSSAFLDDTRPVGDQLKPGAHVTAIPKTHLGADMALFVEVMGGRG